MNNPFQIMGAMSNPQTFLNNIMSNNRLMQDPRAQRAMSMYQNHDSAGLKEMAENLCESYNITTDQAKAEVQKMFGIYN